MTALVFSKPNQDQALRMSGRLLHCAGMKLLRAPLAVALALGTMLAAGRAVDETKPYAQACVTVVDAGEGKESELGGGLKPRAGLRLTVHLDANAEGEALIVALTRKTGQLAHGWRPALCG